VLAQSGTEDDGWFEALVVGAVTDDLLELRWRDYDEPNIVRRREHLALLPPAVAG